MFSPEEAYAGELLMMPILILPRAGTRHNIKIEINSSLASDNWALVPLQWEPFGPMYPNAFAPTTGVASRAYTGLVNLCGMSTY